jgi:hypothetical protein
MDCPWFNSIELHEDVQRRPRNLGVPNALPLQALLFDLTLSCTPANNHGSWTITSCRIKARWNEYLDWGPLEFAQSFNVLTGKFSVIFYDRVPLDAAGFKRQLRIWSGKVFEIFLLRGITHGFQINCRYLEPATLLSDGTIKYVYQAVVRDPFRAAAFVIHGPIGIRPQRLFVDDDFMIIEALHGYSVHAFHANKDATWLFRPQDGPAGLFPDTVFDSISTLKRPSGVELTDPTERVVFQDPNL